AVNYKEFDLGGRYFTDVNAGNYLSETAQHSAVDQTSGNSRIRIQWMNINNPKIDSSIIVQDGWNGSQYTSYYGYRNWDMMILDTIAGANSSKHLDVTYVFNSDFDFNKMNGKTFVLDSTNSNYMDYHVYFQQSKYNYTVTATDGTTATGGIRFVAFTLTSDTDSSKKFTFRILSKSTSNIDFKADALDTDIQSFNLTEDQIHNLETYGNIDGIDTSGFDSSSSSDSSSSYSGMTAQEQQEVAIKEAYFSDGSNGITGYGRGSRSSDHKQASVDENQTQDTSSEKKDDANTQYEKDYASEYAKSSEEPKNEESVDKNAKNTDDSKKEEDSHQSNGKDDSKDSSANNHEDSQNNGKDDSKDSSANNHEDSQDNGKHDTENSHNDNNQNDDNSLANNHDNQEDNSQGKHDNIHDNNDNSNILDNINDGHLDNIFNNNADNMEAHPNISFTDFVGKESDIDLNQLFNSSEELLANTEGLSDSLSEMINSINSIEEDAVHNTNQQDELDSMSFALDSMFNITENHTTSTEASDNHDKHKNSNGFSNS
ncbi:MAG: hypothetical protein LBH40_05310, partial [Alphaproteobacteria bacterium]|nr:hypothetical protein [Alphaproteobacteria bacterium]